MLLLKEGVSATPLIVHCNIYLSNQHRELIGCCWKHKTKETEAPNVCRVIKHSNKVS